MAFIPRGSLLFSGFGNAALRVVSAAGSLLAPTVPEAGQGGTGLIALPSGVIGFSTTRDPWQSNNSFINGGALTASLALLGGEGALPQIDSIAGNYVDKFYSLMPVAAATPGNYVLANISVPRGGNYKLLRFDANGYVDAYYDMGFNNFAADYAIAVAPDQSKAYTRQSLGVETVFAHDLAGARSTFLTAPGRGALNTLLCLSDGTLLVGWGDAASGTAGVTRYSAAAATIQTYTPAGIKRPVCLTPGLNVDQTFWVSWSTSAATLEAREVRIADGQVVNSVSLPLDGSFSYDGPFCVTRANIGSPSTFVPAPIPNAPQAPCDPQSASLGRWARAVRLQPWRRRLGLQLCRTLRRRAATRRSGRWRNAHRQRRPTHRPLVRTRPHR
jgi:hypothetical protein